jgi:hypothetical protein
MNNKFSNIEENLSSTFIDSKLSNYISTNGMLKLITSYHDNIALRLLLILVFSVMFSYSAFSQAVVTYQSSALTNQSGSSGTVNATYTRVDATFNANGTGKVVTDFPASFTVTFPGQAIKPMFGLQDLVLNQLHQVLHQHLIQALLIQLILLEVLQLQHSKHHLLIIIFKKIV